MSYPGMLGWCSQQVERWVTRVGVEVDQFVGWWTWSVGEPESRKGIQIRRTLHGERCKSVQLRDQGIDTRVDQPNNLQKHT
jgi:hypothetical protein